MPWRSRGSFCTIAANHCRSPPRVQDRELRLVKILFAVMLILACIFSVSVLRPVAIVPVVLNFMIWTILGFMLTWVAFNDGVWERLSLAEERVPRALSG